MLVTGCSSGIGKSLAFGLGARGYRVYATARKPGDVASWRDAGSSIGRTTSTGSGAGRR